MRILISIGTLGLGGAEKQAVWLANQLSKTHEVLLVTMQAGPRESNLSSNLTWRNLSASSESKFSKNLFRFRRKRVARSVEGFTLFLKSWAILQRYQPDIVITFLLHDTIIVGLGTILSFHRTKLLVGRRSSIGYGIKGQAPIKRMLLRLVYLRANLAITNSESSFPAAIADGISKSKLLTIPNYVEPISARHQKNDGGPIKLLCVANFFDYKNHIAIVEAISLSEELISNIQISFVGEGPLREEISNLCSSKGLNCKFFDRMVPDSAFYCGYDAFVLTSFHEGSSNALLEALAAGLPAVVSNVGFVPQLLLDGAPLIVVDPKSTESILKGLISLTSNYQKYEISAKEYQRPFYGLYGEENVLSKWNEILI
ncbi:MAG: glycosyltransferase [Actinobacteria bacterium]|nr:glycosyltransferase [Actinomycetota bacterium]